MDKQSRENTTTYTTLVIISFSPTQQHVSRDIYSIRIGDRKLVGEAN